MKLLFLAGLMASITACNLARSGGPTNAGNIAPNISSATPAGEPAVAFGKATPDVTSAAAAECKKVKLDDKWVVVPEQTFAIDFEPFRGSCFVTSKNSEYEGSPVESDFAIYKDGKKNYDFPQQFNGTGFGCWVEAVAFQDLNADGLMDVILVAKCSGKQGTYNESSVYANNGSGFDTDLDANYKLNGFKKVSEVVSYVKENRDLYFK